MNDLTFGATMLSLFAVLVLAVVVETTAAPARNASGAARVTAGCSTPVQPDAGKCTTVALDAGR